MKKRKTNKKQSLISPLAIDEGLFYLMIIFFCVVFNSKYN